MKERKSESGVGGRREDREEEANSKFWSGAAWEIDRRVSEGLTNP
jgi:hypothetical protein